MKYTSNPLSYQFIKKKFIDNNIEYNKESLLYFSNKKLLSIDNNIFQLFVQSSEVLNDLLLELLEDFKRGNYFEYYHFDDKIKNFIYKSLKNEYLAFRFDWGMENNQPKLFEINAESCGFMTECSLIPRWLHQDYGVTTFEYNFYENYITQILKNKNINKLYLGSVNYIYDIQNLQWIKSFLNQKKIDSEIINLNDIDEIDNNFYINNHKIFNLHKIYPWEWIIEDGNIQSFQSINITEPIWTILFNSKIVLYLLYKKYKNHSFLLETYYNENVHGKFIEKKFNSMQGCSVIKSNGNKKWSNSILQRQIEPVKLNKDILIFNTWIINDKFSGMGIKTDKKIISNDKHKFVAVSIEY